MSENAPLCRYKLKDLTVDIMSPDAKVLGFSNKWYKEGIEKSKKISFGKLEVSYLSLPYFLGTKLEAFKDRGKKDYHGSSDLEDIITVLDLSDINILEDDLENISTNLKKYLHAEFLHLQNIQGFLDALPGAVFDRVNVTARVNNIKARLKNLLNY